MIVTCDGCKTKYLLGDEKVPETGIRVRCPMCRYVWKLTPPAPDSIFEVTSEGFAADAPVAEAPQGGWAAMEQPRTAVMSEAEPAAMDQEIEIGEAAPAPEEKPAISPEQRKRVERARRQARVYVSDILVYNKEKRDNGLKNGDLMTALGPEIKKAWEAYKEKVGPDLVESSDYFRDALNDILADGQKIF